MRMVRQTAALICCHAAARGVVIEPALAAEIALDVHVDIEAPLGYQCVNTEMLNVRSGPSADYEQLFQLPEKQRVEVWGRLDDWSFVMWDDGEGWVSADYLGDCDSKAFHEALEVDTGGAKPTIYDLSTVRGRLGSLVYRCRWWLKKQTRQSQR